MNQDKNPGVNAAMGEMEMRHHERLPMENMGIMRHDNMHMGEMGARRYDNMPMGEMGARRYDNMPMGQMDNWYRENMQTNCIDHETELRDVELAHAYVPFQKLCPTFMPLAALRKGTIFPGLVGVYGWKPRQEMGGE